MADLVVSGKATVVAGHGTRRTGIRHLTAIVAQLVAINVVALKAVGAAAAGKARVSRNSPVPAIEC